MKNNYAAPWHARSYQRFFQDRLPALLAERIPLAGYRVEPAGSDTLRIIVEINAREEPVRVVYGPVPTIDAEGVLTINGKPHVVVPTASSENLDTARMACIGEQLFSAIQSRLGQAPEDMIWDEAIARAFLPLDTWINDFLDETAQHLDTTNWSSRQTHLRRIIIPNRKHVIASGQMGRVDPFETPEGPNIGRVFTIAAGAEIREEALVITDDRPEAALGHNARMVPFLEHDDANRLLMGVNMMRQGLVPEDPEPALVQTGYEPENPGADLWCGRNLLTAFIAWGEGVVEDGIILSQSAAQRLNYPYPAEIGDKLANRHGTKGVVSQVLPDDEMPHLADGRPVELIFSFSGLATRMNFGQIREAVMGRIAQAEGAPAIVPPFCAPSDEEIQARLVKNGLPASGMERLHAGKQGPELPFESTAGYVYWYRLAHLARGKLEAFGAAAAQPGGPLDHHNDQPGMGDLEIQALVKTGALNNAREALTTRAQAWQAGHPSPYLARLSSRLAAAGLAVEIKEEQLALHFTSPSGAVLNLARPLPHPWLREQRIEQVGAPPEAAGPEAQRAYRALAEANTRLARWLAAQTPSGTGQTSAYLDGLFSQVETRLAAYFDALLPQSALQIAEPQAYSGRAVIAPGIGLRLDQVGLPETIAKAFFGEQADQENKPLDAILAERWVIVLRGPVIGPTSLIAFHPVQVDGPAIRLHPQASILMNADYDGDQVEVFLPLSAEAQHEAGETLSVAGHIRRNPALVSELIHPHEAVWGLAWLARQPDGAAEIARLLDTPVEDLSSPLTQETLAGLVRQMVDQAGIEVGLANVERLARLGYQAASNGASLSPFPTAGLHLLPQPESNAIDAWEPYLEAVREQILANRSFDHPVLGPQSLSAAIRPRSRRFLPLLVGPRIAYDIAEQPAAIRGCNASGFSAEAMFTMVAGARRGLAQLVFQAEQYLQPQTISAGMPGPREMDMAPLTLLARARHSKRPGIVFARAAASGEVDPLRDPESQILVG